MKAIPTMTPEQEAEWIERVRRGEVFPTRRRDVPEHGWERYQSIADPCRCDICYAGGRGYRFGRNALDWLRDIGAEIPSRR